jgi:hypothetical protein
MENNINKFVIGHEGNDPKNCFRCQNSVRPLCKKCNHALTANISFDKTTVCENCGLLQEIKFPG